MKKIVIEIDDDKLDAETIKKVMINEVYNVGCLFFEFIGEGKQILMGNGHHMAQDLASKAEDIWNEHLPRNNKQ